ncbi:MAG TPA: glycosyltransferase [Solirubrobacter sp.]|nr:glycosyltransferase [Solirubrobacter sp.]
MRVAVVAEYYPRAADPALGVWAHRQALAARAAGADVEVFVLHRPVPSRAALRTRRGLLEPLRQPLRAELDGIRVTYVPFVAPPRSRSYPAWGAWAAPTLAVVLKRRRFDLIHAHYAAPAGDAARRVRPDTPLVISVHGGDVLGLVDRWRGGRAVVSKALKAARLTLANSQGIAGRARELGAREVRVVHLGTDVPAATTDATTLVTVGNLIARKRHADVARALATLPQARWVVIGDGPERPALERLTAGLDVEFRGALPPQQALQAARECGVFVLPSVDEAFGVAYVEAMAGGLPAIGTKGEPGPEEIAACGGGMLLVPPNDPAALAAAIRTALEHRRELGAAARANVAANFTWEACGRATVAAYEDALR